LSEQNNISSIVKKLDLDSYVEQFESFLSRAKPIAMMGDINQHYRYIKALFKVEFNPPKQILNLDNQLNRIKKQAILSLEEIYAFVNIVSYFNTLKTLAMPEPLFSWISEIQIPDEILEIVSYFNDNGEINSQKDQELYMLEGAIKQNRRDIKDRLYALAHSSRLKDYLVDTQVHFNSGEETLLVRGGFNSVLKATVVGRSSGGFFYIIPQSISDLKEKESRLLSSKEEIIYRYTKEFSAIFHKWERFLSYLNREFDRFDSYQARVMFARTNDYEFVLPSKQKGIELSSFAHPAIKGDVVPVTIKMNKPILLITGVNAGGKTMLLKSLLSAVWMSKYLLPFRCEVGTTKIGHFKSIEAVIDDPQSVKNDISTFAGRMQEFAKLYKKSDAIVGVDEIELGTDSDEAASLFRVMLSSLEQKGIWFVVTTHHKRLASLMASDDNVELIAALYDEAKREPTYTFLQGSIGKSYAFETALRYGVPESIVLEAKKVYGEDKENLNELIEKSTSLEREMRQKIASVENELSNLSRAKQKLQDKEAKLQEEHRKALATLENRYNAAIKRAQEALKVKESTEGRRLLNEAHKYKSMPTKEPQKPKEPLKVGDRVKYRSHKGELLSIKAKEATIEVDGLKMRVPLKDLRKITQTTTIKPKSKPPKINHSVEKNGASVSIKVLGMFTDEAIESVDKFISDALVNGIDEVQIIHGTGGGILAKLIGEYLSTHPKIQRYYRQKGNLGITIVEL